MILDSCIYVHALVAYNVNATVLRKPSRMAASMVLPGAIVAFAENALSVEHVCSNFFEDASVPKKSCLKLYHAFHGLLCRPFRT